MSHVQCNITLNNNAKKRICRPANVDGKGSYAKLTKMKYVNLDTALRLRAWFVLTFCGQS